MTIAARGIHAEGTQTHPIAIVPAALVSLGAVLQFWVMTDWGYLPMIATASGPSAPIESETSASAGAAASPWP